MVMVCAGGSGGSGGGGLDAMKRGTELFKSGNFEEAIGWYESASKDAGETSNDVKKKCYSNIAACHLKLGDDAIAEVWARRCIEQDSSWSKSHARLAACFSSRRGDKNASTAIASYRTALAMAEKKSGDERQSIELYSIEIANHICNIFERNSTDGPSRDGSRDLIPLGPSSIAELVTCSKLVRYPTIRIASVLTCSQLASSSSHRQLFFEPESGNKCSSLMEVLLDYACISIDDMDRFCCQRSALTKPNLEMIDDLHKRVTGKYYREVHPLSSSIVGLSNLLSQEALLRGPRNRGYAMQKPIESSCSYDKILFSFLSHKRLMETLKQLVFRRDTCSDLLIFDCLGRIYKKLIEGTCSGIYKSSPSVADGSAGSSALLYLLRAGVPDTILKMIENAEAMELENQALFLRRLYQAVVRHPDHPDNQIPTD